MEQAATNYVSAETNQEHQISPVFMTWEKELCLDNLSKFFSFFLITHTLILTTRGWSHYLITKLTLTKLPFQRNSSAKTFFPTRFHTLKQFVFFSLKNKIPLPSRSKKKQTFSSEKESPGFTQETNRFTHLSSQTKLFICLKNTMESFIYTKTNV